MLLAWIRVHNAKVRESVKGSGSLAQRLSGESEESELSHQWAQSSGGEALKAKMLELRMRRRALA